MLLQGFEEQLFDFLATRSRLLVCCVEKNGRIISYNRAFAHIAGLVLDNGNGNFTDFLLEESLPEFKKLFTTKPSTAHLNLVFPDHPVTTIDFHLTWKKEDLLLIAEDITISDYAALLELNRLHGEMDTLNSQLQKKTQQLEKLSSDLQRKNAELERLNKIFIDREFRIKDLKEQLKQLEMIGSACGGKNNLEEIE